MNHLVVPDFDQSKDHDARKTANFSAVNDHRVPAEFAGQARAFRAKIHATSLGAQMAEILAYSLDLIRRHNSSPQPWHLIAIERRWRSMSTTGCLGLDIQRRSRSIIITDTRIIAAKSASSEWEGTREPSICLIVNSLSLRKRRVETKATTLAAISLHAMGRWYQRAFVTNDVSLIGDLNLVAVASASLIAQTSGMVAISTKNGGTWRGAIVDATDGGRVVNIRTFV